MKQFRGIVALWLALFLASPVLAQTNQGTSPLTGSKGGTNNAFMQFTGPASSIKTYTLPNASGTVDLLNAVQTISAAKTFNDLTLILAGSSSGTTTLKASATASGVLTFPATTDTIVARNTTDTLTNKTLTNPVMTTPTLGAATATSINKVVITAPATGATITIPDGVTFTGPAASGTAMTLGNPETVSGAKSFNDATVILKGSTSGTTTVKAAAAAGTTTVTLPSATDTLVGKATTDTLTNKTFDTAGAGNSLSINGVAATANTGTGALARAVSPVFTTPTLGAALATSINKVAITSPATSATLTLIDGTSVTGPAGTGTLATLANPETLTNKTLDTASNTFKINGAAFGTATQGTAALNGCVGDGGSGGTKGMVPAPGAGDFAAGKFLDASCQWSVPAGGGGGGGISDTDRRNILLDRIYQSKLYGGYRRSINAFADGYKASDGVNAGSSSNYSVNTTSGFVAPTVTIGSRISGGTPTMPLGGTASNINDNSTGTTATSTALGDLSAASVAGRIVAKIDFGSAQQIGRIEQKNAALSAASDAGTGLYYSTDNTNWTLIGATFTISTSTGSTTIQRDAAITARYVALAVGQNVYSTITLTMADLNAYASTAGNMTLITTSQTADASVSNVRALLEYDSTASPTLNTDLTVEVTCDGGTNWASASLSSVSVNGQAGRKIAETVDQACAPGTSFAARIKTLNNKNVSIYGTSLTVH